MGQDKRRRTRIDAEFTVQISKKGFGVEVATHNLSMKGILCDGVEGFSADDACTVSIALSEDIIVIIEGRVVRADKTGLAVDFVAMDEVSFTHLRKMVKYNSTDADSIDGELISPAFDV
ncbi:PilZ domain-containing protein [Maridesulfovibrio frigidus]|uniref:PilZ domain-containing protein n=1 Tax=Maridesulfovibrio frigidus TaxID=340956 RepID=UPI0004E1D97B|nr:PilZ domain-containing protein [Maridesulfovibrio frigidus]